MLRVLTIEIVVGSVLAMSFVSLASPDVQGSAKQERGETGDVVPEQSEAGTADDGKGASNPVKSGIEDDKGLTSGRRSVRESPWALEPALESGLVAGSLLFLSIDVAFASQNRGPWCGAACDLSAVPAFERQITGWYNPDAAIASDVLLGIAVGGPVLAQIIDTAVSKPSDGWKGFGSDMLVLAETAALTTGITNLIKYSVGRPRPYAYNESLSAEKRTEPDAGLSFPSGHTSLSFAMATSWSVLFMKRHPDSPAVIPVWIGSYALATTTALLRPVAGKHYWTDIIAGAALGVSIGLLVPYFHELIAKSRRADRKMNIVVSPAVMEGGAGAVVTITK